MSTRRTALELNLIAVARQADQVCEMSEDSFENSVRAALDGTSVRRIASVVEEIAAWLEDESHLLVWDGDHYSVIPEPDDYQPPPNGPVVAGPYGKAV